MFTELAIPTQSEAVTLTSGDYAFKIIVDAIYVGTAGTVYLKMRRDADYQKWVVQAGATIYGDFESVRKLGTTADDMLGLRSRRS